MFPSVVDVFDGFTLAYITVLWTAWFWSMLWKFTNDYQIDSSVYSNLLLDLIWGQNVRMKYLNVGETSQVYCRFSMLMPFNDAFKILFCTLKKHESEHSLIFKSLLIEKSDERKFKHSFTDRIWMICQTCVIFYE